MTVIVTGAAGFIGYHVCLTLLAQGEHVVGIDSVNPYYDPKLKEARLAQLTAHPAFAFHRVNLADRDGFAAATAGLRDVRRFVHLAAQAGVRYSLDHPFAYVESNIYGHLTVLEYCRHLDSLEHLVYASSSSVYGGNTKLPFSVEDSVEKPASLYAATKRADELMSYTYSHLYRVPQTGLRFFTVYGPWGRPDMAAFIFTRALLAGEPIEVFNHGDMMRDFTYVDDIVGGVLALLGKPPQETHGEAPHRVFNIGNHKPEPLMRMIAILEEATGRKAEMVFKPMQPGDVKETYADIEPLRKLTGFTPKTPIQVGLPRFVQWYRDYYKV